MEREIRKQYETETGQKWWIIPYTRRDPQNDYAVNAYASREYQLWLEKKVSYVEKPAIIFNPKRSKMCLIHKWTKWEQYTEKGAMVMGRIAPKNIQGKEFRYEELKQKRHCERCNKMQDERVE